MHDPWHPETDEEEAAMMERLDPEEREILEAINDPHYVFPRVTRSVWPRCKMLPVPPSPKPHG